MQNVWEGCSCYTVVDHRDWMSYSQDLDTEMQQNKSVNKIYISNNCPLTSMDVKVYFKKEIELYVFLLILVMLKLSKL